MNDRRLLPYEHALVDALGITKEEYLNFLAVQHDYTRTPEQKLETPQADALTTAIVLTVVGILFQVASVLLMPRPDMKNRQQPRDQRFAPRFGFNSSQELAQYGDPVNLVYTNSSQNPKGGVRINMSLVWSAVESYGASQFMQLLLVAGAAEIRRMDFNRVAFGQLPLSSFSAANTWLYYNRNGKVLYGDRRIGDLNDPSKGNKPESVGNEQEVCLILAEGQRRQGYSQAFSPSSMTTWGVYDPIPVNINVVERDQKGRINEDSLGIKIVGDGWRAGSNAAYAVGNEISLEFAQAPAVDADVDKDVLLAYKAAKDARFEYLSSLDQGSTYMLGTAKFKLRTITGDITLETDKATAVFECVERGVRPSTQYGTLTRETASTAAYSNLTLRLLEQNLEILEKPFEQTTRSPVDLVRPNSRFTQKRANKKVRADYEEMSADLLANSKDVVFSFEGTSYNFSGTQTITWTNAAGVRQSFSIQRNGSKAVTKRQLEGFLTDKPKLSTKESRDAQEEQIENLRALRDAFNAGDYDDVFRKEARKTQAVKKIDNEISKLQLDRRAANQRGDIKAVQVIDQTLENFRADKADEINKIVALKRTEKIKIIRNSPSPFTLRDLLNNVLPSGVPNSSYLRGINPARKLLTQLEGERVTDQIGTSAVRSAYRQLIREKEEAIKFLQLVTDNWQDFQGDPDDFFFTKCLVKADTASYQTITECDYVRFAMKCRVYRRISGRTKKYGEKRAPDGFLASDNGIKPRMAFFLVRYRQLGASTTYTTYPAIFALRRASEQENFIGLRFHSPSRSKWEFKFEAIGDIGATLAETGITKMAFIENAGGRTRDGAFSWQGTLVDFTGKSYKEALQERGPVFTNDWDLFSNTSDTSIQFSFDNGPEFAITAVTEQQLANTAGKYADMSMVAFGAYSGRGVQDLRSISGYVTEGKNCWRYQNGVPTLSNSSTSYAPDIFADTVLDPVNGIGKYAKPEGIDWKGLDLARNFCKNNGLGCQFFMDGVIADLSSWRQFWAEVAPYSLLEFARVGGRETLQPAIPVTSSGVATRDINVTALFNQGNILEGSYKEEFIDYGAATQDLIATVIYRESEVNDIFPRNASVEVSLRSVYTSDNEPAAIRETFDISQFVTQRAQAILFGKMLCNQRHWIRRGVEFQTFPTDSPVSPGAYIFVDIGLNTWDRTTSGIVEAGGALNIPLNTAPANGTYNVLLYKNNRGDVTSLTGIAVANATAPALASYEGSLFVLGSVSPRRRVFRVTEVNMDEEGLVTIKAVEHPCQSDGARLLSRVADFSDSLFRIR